MPYFVTPSTLVSSLATTVTSSSSNRCRKVNVEPDALAKADQSSSCVASIKMSEKRKKRRFSSLPELAILMTRPDLSRRLPGSMRVKGRVWKERWRSRSSREWV